MERDREIGAGGAGARLAAPAPRLVRREIELGRIEEALRAEDVAGVFVHGAGGVGKTALLRRAAETAAREDGFTVTWLDGRDIAPAPDELDLVVGAEKVECHVIDWGPGGVVAALREHLYRELGLAPPPRPAAAAAVSVEAVSEAFRNLHDPAALAASPLAAGEEAEERAASVRQALTTAVAGAFGTAPGEALTRTVLRQGYLERRVSDDAIATRLGLSRAAYLRRLRRGCEQVARHLSAGAARQEHGHSG